MADEKKTAKKPSVFARIGASFKNFKAEFKKIVWSSRKDTFHNTVLVIVSIIVVAVAIGLLDIGFSSLLSAIAKLV